MRLLLWVGGVFVALLGVVQAGGNAFDVVDEDGIYFGEGKHPKAPAVCKADDVWAEIPEYKEVLADELEDDDPRYHLLMKKATERFNKALDKVADREDYDMVAEVGAIEANGDNKKEIPEVTKELIKLVTRD